MGGTPGYVACVFTYKKNVAVLRARVLLSALQADVQISSRPIMTGHDRPSVITSHDLRVITVITGLDAMRRVVGLIMTGREESRHAMTVHNKVIT